MLGIYFDINRYDTNYQETYRLDLQDILEDTNDVLTESTSQSEIDKLAELVKSLIEEVKSYLVT